MSRNRRRHDDLLSGLNQPDQRAVQLRGFFASTLGASLVAWTLAFDLGAYHTVFYSRLLQLVVVAAVLQFGALAVRRQISVRPATRLVLAVPLLWLLFRLVVPPTPDDGWYQAADRSLMVLTLLSVPMTMWALARIFMPEHFALSSRRLRAIAIGIVLLVALTGFLAGHLNHQLLVCRDFVVAGDDTPANCRPPR